MEIAITRAKIKAKVTTREQIVRFQIIVYANISRIKLSAADIDLLTLLGIKGKSVLIDFCILVSDNKIFNSIQSTRNATDRLQEKGLIVKECGSKKDKRNRVIYLNPEMKIYTEGNILVDLNCIYYEF